MNLIPLLQYYHTDSSISANPSFDALYGELHVLGMLTLVVSLVCDNYLSVWLSDYVDGVCRAIGIPESLGDSPADRHLFRKNTKPIVHMIEDLMVAKGIIDKGTTPLEPIPEAPAKPKFFMREFTMEESLLENLFHKNK